jgi:hypothetical protein
MADVDSTSEGRPLAEDLDSEAFLNRPSSLRNIGTTMRGFGSEQEAHEIGSIVLGFLSEFGRFLDLERLDTVTIAFDYDVALAEVERGFGTQRTLAKTKDEFAVGIAMTPTVMRNGQPYSQMVINAGLVYCLKESLDSPDAKLAIHILAHEAAHAHDLLQQDRAFPGLYGTAIPDYRKGILFSMAHGCWEEYIASRLSAGFGDMPERMTHFESTFSSALKSARKRGNSAILAYRTHARINDLVAELVAIYGKVLLYGAYLVGHLDGLQQTVEQSAAEAHRVVGKTAYFQSIFDLFQSELRKMYESYGRWSSVDVFTGLEGTAEDLLNAAGIAFQRQPNGMYWVDVP